MCRDIDMVKTIANPNAPQEEALLSPARPVVLVPKKKNMEQVTELDTVGIMLPYTALHYLLFDYLEEPIVMTSSNQSDEPITTTKEEQSAPYILDHSRVIANVADDSVVKIIAGHTFYIRRSRGFVPASIKVPTSDQNILALGAEMQNTFCVYKKEGEAILSQHMGNTSNIATFEHYKDTIQKFLDFTTTTPDLLVADLHPSYNTAQYAELLSEQLHIPLLRVQHHKAHAYGVALEHGLTDFVAIVADGLGYGEDGTIWGGEIFHNDERVGHLEQHMQVGGDSAAQYPAKMLFSILRNFLSLEEATKYIQSYFTIPELALLDKQRANGFNSPLTSSCGRILDTASFLLGFCDERTYDGRPAMLLEANSFGQLKFAPVIENNILMTTPLFEFLIQNLDQDKKRLAATVQRYLAKGLYAIAKQYDKPITFSGGCAYNSIMSGYMLEQGVKVHKNIPSGDAGISFGQIAYVLSGQS
jgi:hydrogenase maturation protein HypF